MTMDAIDFVVLWVDGNDPEWRRERAKYAPDGQNADTSEVRFRDWDMMRYWFRGVEKFAPWVNHVYFVTCGHYPQWLNLEHPRLTLVKHSDFIPEEFLPTFNSNTIELHIHRIQGLQERFVLFNDDMFLTKPVVETDFFWKGIPRETAILGQLSPVEWGPFNTAILNNMTVINQNFKKKNVIQANKKKFFSLKYGKYFFQNILLSKVRYFSSFRDMHLPTSYLKSTFHEVWKSESGKLTVSSRQRFRSREDLTHWLMKYWQFCTGRFYPRSVKWGKMFTLGVDRGWAESICTQRYKAVCLNDSAELDFPVIQQEMKEAFETILHEKSKFEKD